MTERYSPKPLRERADTVETELLEEKHFPVLEQALPENRDGEARYELLDLRDMVPNRDPYISADQDSAQENYDWPILHDDERVPHSVESVPQYFVATDRGQVYDGEYIAAIDHVIKYIAVDEAFHDDRELVQALYTFATSWDNDTAVTGEYGNPYGDDVNLDYVKFLDDLPVLL